MPRHIVGHVGRGLGHGVDALEIAHGAQVGAHPLLDLGHDRCAIALELLGSVFCQLGDGRLG